MIWKKNEEFPKITQNEDCSKETGNHAVVLKILRTNKKDNFSLIFTMFHAHTNPTVSHQGFKEFQFL